MGGWVWVGDTYTLLADGEECDDHHVQTGQVEQEHPSVARKQ